MHTIRPFRRRQKKYIIEDSRQNYNYNLWYQKVMYNIGTEILMLQYNLHNSTQEAPTELSVCVEKS